MNVLALHGGTPVRTRPWVSKYVGSEELGQAEKDRLMHVLDKKRVFRYYPDGIDESETAELEKEYADFIGTSYALAVNSGTSALICALIAAGVRPGDEVIIPAYTWVATAGAVVTLGAIPVLCEIDASLTIDPEDLEERISPRTRAVIAVHMRGISCDMDQIMAIAKRRQIKVIEDVAQANGGSYKGKMLGSFGDLGCFSLQQSKVITTGEGGMVVTNSEELWQRAVLYHDGAMYQFRFTDRKIPAFAGQNYRLTELQAALSLGQIQKMPKLISRTRQNKQSIVAELRKVQQIYLPEVFGSERDLGISVVFYGRDAEQATFFAEALTAEGIPAHLLFDPKNPDQHTYVNWEFLMNKQDPWGGSYPWDGEQYKGDAHYSRASYPQTLELLGRAVQIHLNHLVTDDDIQDLVLATKKITQ